MSSVQDPITVKRDDFEPEHKDVGKHVTNGVFNSGLVQIVKVISQFGTVVILCRLLSPTDFGLLAMVNPILGFIALFQSLGLNQATVQKANLSHEEVNAVFWLNTGLGLILSLIMAILSPLLGLYYHDPRVVTLSMAMAILIFTGALGNQHGTILQRRMKFGTMSFIDVIGTLSALLTSILIALIYKSYWALYFGTVIGNIVPVIGVWIACKWRPTFPKYVSGLGDILKFGAGVTSFSITNFLSKNLDNVLIGRVWGDQILGLYDRAYKLMLFPIQRMVLPFGGVMTPLLSRLIDDPERYKIVFLKTLRQLTLVTWPGILWALIFAHTLIPTLLGPTWTSAISIFEPLAIVGMIQVLNSTTSWLFLSQGRSGDYARWGIINATSSIVAFVIGISYGATYVAIAYAISECIWTPFLWWLVTKSGPVHLYDIHRSITPQIISCAATATLLICFQYYMGHMAVWLLLFISILLAYSITIIIMLLFPSGRDTLQQTLAFIYRAYFQMISKKSS